MTYDRRTGKPIASLVSKIAPEVVMSEERVIGAVTTETHRDAETKNEVHGRISYENRGECFFLPFTQSDVEGNVTLASGDKVTWLLIFVKQPHFSQPLHCPLSPDVYKTIALFPPIYVACARRAGLCAVFRDGA